VTSRILVEAVAARAPSNERGDRNKSADVGKHRLPPTPPLNAETFIARKALMKVFRMVRG